LATERGIPVVLMEAMAVGVPVVSTKISGIAELIQDGETGFLANPSDPASLADSLEQVYRDSNLPIIIKKARLVIENQFSIQGSVNRLTQEILEGSYE